MSLLSKGVGLFVRGTEAVATGGASEAYRAVTGHSPEQDIGNAIKGGYNKATDFIAGPKAPPNPYTQTPEQAQRVQQHTVQGDVDVNNSRAYADYLRRRSQMVNPRVAPAVGGVHPINAAQAQGPTMVSSSFDPSIQAGSQGQQGEALGLYRSAALGEAPSAAEQLMREASARNVAASYALASGHKGYGGDAIRQAQRQEAASGQQLTTEVGAQRAAEMAQAREGYASLATGARGQDIGLATTGADLALRAATSNQGAELQTRLANAGFNQQAIMQMSDNELRTKLANAGFQLSQEQIDDLRQQNASELAIQGQGQALAAGASQQDRDLQIQQLRTDYQLAAMKHDTKRQQAVMSMLEQLGGKAATMMG